jgi:hypothetical protein
VARAAWLLLPGECDSREAVVGSDNLMLAVVPSADRIERVAGVVQPDRGCTAQSRNPRNPDGEVVNCPRRWSSDPSGRMTQTEP